MKAEVTTKHTKPTKVEETGELAPGVLTHLRMV
jgi:hypothetical protein